MSFQNPSLSLFTKGAIFFGLAFLLTGCQQTEVLDEAAIREQFGKIPLSFEENKGQVDSVVQYLVKNGTTTMFFTPEEVVYNMTVQDEKEVSQNYTIRQHFEGANTVPEILGMEKLPGVSNYMIGDQELDWVKGIKTFAKIQYKNLYPGIDLEYSGVASTLKYAFSIAPEADYHQIQVKLAGVDDLEINDEGSLVMKTVIGDMIVEKPVTFQEVDGEKLDIESSYVLLANDTYGFSVGKYDPSFPLVIDPKLYFGSYHGRTGTDEIYGIQVDSSGNIYLAGQTTSTTWTGSKGVNGYDTSHNGGIDVFVFKLDPTATTRTYGTYIGSSGADVTTGLVVNSSDEAIVAGYTSGAYPTTGGAYDTVRNSTDGFISKLSSDGTTLSASTFFGGEFTENINGVAVDSSGNVYITGTTDSTETSSPSFPLVSAYDSTQNGSIDGFFAKFNSGLSTLSYSSFIGSINNEVPRAIAVNSSNEIFITGEVTGNLFPVTGGAYQSVASLSTDGFITKVSSGGGSLAYSSYLGGTGDDLLKGIAVDGNIAVVVGETSAGAFPTKNALYSSRNGVRDGVVAKFNTASSGSSSLEYSTHFGGSQLDSYTAAAIDDDGNAYAFGNTTSSDYPLTSTTAPQTTFGTAPELVVTKINDDGSAIMFSTFVSTSPSFGGNGTDTPYAMSIDRATGMVYGAGSSTSSNLSTSGAFQSAKSTGTDGYFFQLSTVNAAPDVPVASTPANGGTVYTSTPTIGALYSDLDVNDTGTTHFRVSSGSAADCLSNTSIVYSGTSVETARNSQVVFVLVSGVSDNNTYNWCAQNDDGVLTSGAGYTAMGSFTVDASNANFRYGTFLGGDLNDAAVGVGFDTSGNVVVIASTGGGFPTTSGAFQETDPTSPVGNSSIGVSKFSDDLSSLLVSTYIGDVDPVTPRHGKVDDNGNVYIAGHVSGSLPQPTIPNGYDTTPDVSESGDVFLIKMNEDLDTMLYATYLSGEGYDDLGGLAVHPTNGKALLTGYTDSSPFPTTAGAFDSTADASNGDAFASFIDTTLSGASSLIYSTYIGGTADYEWSYYPAMDSTGIGYVTGETYSSNFATTVGAFDTTVDSSNGDGFIVKIDPAGNSSTSLLYGSIVGGSVDYEAVYAVALDGPIVYLCGSTESSDFVTTAGAYDQSLSGTADGFVYRMILAGSGSDDLINGTYIGGTVRSDYCDDMMVGSDHAPIFVGSGTTGYPTTSGAFDETYNGTAGRNVVLTKMTPDLSDLVYSTYFDGPNVGNNASGAHALAQHSSGDIYFAGETYAPDFPVTGYDTFYGETALLSLDAFVAQLEVTDYTPAAPPVGVDIVVTSVKDTNARDTLITLREAIMLSEGTLLRSSLDATEQESVGVGVGAGVADVIGFNIPGAGVKTITPTTALPTIADTAATTINGYTQSDSTANTNATGALNTVLRIDLNGASLPASTTLLSLNSNNNVLKGLVIRGAKLHGVAISATSTGNKIQGNFIGTNAAGTSASGNVVRGIDILGDSNTVGTDGDGTNDAAERNLISGNGAQGVYMLTNADNNVVAGNLIGTDINGTADVGNTESGIVINDSDNNRIGTNGNGVSDATERNVISGNNGATGSSPGIYIISGSTANTIAGNFIGTNAAGTGDLGNSNDGLLIDQSNGNIVGVNGDGSAGEANEGNVISGNDRIGILLYIADATTIAGNYIGTNAAGTSALPNAESGIQIMEGSDSTIVGTDGDGTSDALERNVISGNTQNGVILYNSSDNVFAGNIIGLNAAGDAALGNVITGLEINASGGESSRNRIGTNDDGVSDALERNIISGNNQGITIYDSSDAPDSVDNVIAGNYIGTDITGTAAFPNDDEGIDLYSFITDTIVGYDGTGDPAVERNIISGNGWGGIYTGHWDTPFITNTIIRGNYVGLDVNGDPLPNGGRLVDGGGGGIFLADDAAGYTIEENIIAYNIGVGVGVLAGDAYTNTIHNRITQNSIFDNTGLAIDLSVDQANYRGDGPTANDVGDTDTSLGDSVPNEGMNYPVITEVTANGSNITVNGTIDTGDATDVDIEVYLTNDHVSGTGYGDLYTYLGTATPSDLIPGTWSLTISNSELDPFISVIAIDANGNTSEPSFTEAETGGGPAVPDAITNLVAIGGNSQVSLTWTAPANNGSAITDYIVEYGETSGFPGNAQVFADGASASTGATVTGLVNGTDYSFRVAAVNGVGTGPYSNVDTAMPAAGAAPQYDADSDINVDVNDFLSFEIENFASGDEPAGDQPFGAGAQITDLTSNGVNDYAISGNFGTPVFTRLQTTTNSSDGYNVVAYASNASGRTNVLLRTGGTGGNSIDEIPDSVDRLPSAQSANDTLTTSSDTGIAFRLQDAGTSSVLREADEDTQWGDNDSSNALWASFPLGSGAAHIIYDTLNFSSVSTTGYINWFVGISSQQRSGAYSGQVIFSATVN